MYAEWHTFCHTHLLQKYFFSCFFCVPASNQRSLSGLSLILLFLFDKNSYICTFFCLSLAMERANREHKIRAPFESRNVSFFAIKVLRLSLEFRYAGAGTVFLAFRRQQSNRTQNENIKKTTATYSETSSPAFLPNTERKKHAARHETSKRKSHEKKVK